MIASVTFDMTSRTVSRISWKSMTDTFGNFVDQIVLELRARRGVRSAP